ncbi:MAG TPA: hypothetical protein VLT57_05550, partial [Bryobacteraceae bacterium]|nr:hypothetical protein [Bryobacteraceae bacterium]
MLFNFPLRRFLPSALLAALLLPAFATPVSAQSAPASLNDRRTALHSLFNDYWQAYLQQNPEFASTIGDK